MNKKEIRYDPDIVKGLTKKEIKERKEKNLVNIDQTVPTKKIKEIILGNIFTLFNMLNLVLATSILLVGSFKNLLFMGGVICNTLISIIQEIRTKRTIDKLSLLATTKAHVIRDFIRKDIHIEEIVLDDIITFKVGEQVVVDTIIKKGSCEVNEAFLTGEEDPVYKKEGDLILSGSFIISGNIIGKVEHVGMENYTSKISKEARYIKKVNSILMNSLNKVIKWTSILIVPLGSILFIKQLYLAETTRDAVVNTVAAVIGMIPEGLVLLTSTVLAVGILKLSRYKILVQELYCIEMLARTDVLCLDKTGTLTEGKMQFVKIEKEKAKQEEIENILCAFTKHMEENATIKAIKEKFYQNTTLSIKQVIPFSSERKYSALETENGYYILGAPEYILDKKDSLLKKVDKSFQKYRILLLAKKRRLKENSTYTPLAFLFLEDVIRKKAKETIAYFQKEDVEIKVISGDNPITVSRIAERVEIKNADKYIDMREVKDKEIKNIVEKYTVFGRVSPIQKKKLILALKEKGHTVAMTGDGVNDVLALKEADCSIAMNSGSDAARNVSQIVLLDSNFEAMPSVVLEGRQTINNIEKSSILYLTKTMYATMLAILFLFINKEYPFEPIQLTLTSVVAIGIPSVFLALEPNKKRIHGNFFTNVFGKAFPFSVVVVINIILIMIFSNIFSLNSEETSTLCVIMNAIISFLLLFRICIPFNARKIILFIAMVALFLYQVLGFRTLFSLANFELRLFFIVIILILISLLLLARLVIFAQKKLEKKYK